MVTETLRERKTLSEICKEYDLHPNQITDWKKLVIDQLPSLFERGEGVKKAEVIDNDTKSITGIAFRSPFSGKTSKGIYIGMPMQAAIDIYGKPHWAYVKRNYIAQFLKDNTKELS